LSFGDVDVVEAHGTGTTLGDPIEAQALLATYGQGRPVDRPLWLGSLKSNIGHTQAAAGVAGVIKMVMALRHGVLPRTLHVDEPTPQVDWSAGSVELLTEQRPWPVGEGPRRAGVSAFGVSGTNAHVILEQAEPTPSASEPEVETHAEAPVVPWILSARSEAALRGQVERLAAYVAARPDLDPVAVARSLVDGRALLEHRAVAVGAGREQLLQSLDRVVRGVPVAGKLAVLFAGQGSQRVGMGRVLCERYSVFDEVFSVVCGELDGCLGGGGVSVRDVVLGVGGVGLLDRTVFAQAGLFAVEVALFRLVESWGVRVDFVAGHSVGELVAAHVAGVLSLSDAAALVAARGRLMDALPDGGAMIAIDAGETEVLAECGTDVDVAAVNGPSAVVISGPADATLAVAAVFAGRGRRTKRLRVSHAFHSAMVDGMLDEFRAVAAGLSYHAPTLPVVSCLADADLREPEHWVRHARRPVRFHDGVTALREAGASTFLELGPGGVLTAMAQDADGDEAAFIPALHRAEDEALDLVTALARLHVRGVAVDWAAFFGDGPVRHVDLPTYAFQHRRFWLDLPGDVVTGRAAPVLAEPPATPERVERRERRRVDLEQVLAGVAEVLGHAGGRDIDPDRSFKDLGFDSLNGVRLRNLLQDRTGRPLPSTLVFDHPTPLALAGFLAEGDDVAEAAPASADDEPIAIVGMACRLPGGVESSEQLWDLVLGGRDGIGDFPADRGWDLEGLFDPDPDHPGTSYTRAGGFLRDAAMFDAEFFGISPREAVAMDPQQRLLLEASWEAIERTRASIRLAARQPDRRLRRGDLPRLSAAACRRGRGILMTGGAASVVGSRVVFARAGGPGGDGGYGVLVVAGGAAPGRAGAALGGVHAGAGRRRDGDGDPARSSSSPVSVGLAADGRCKAYAAAADGTGWGEGVGVLVVERLSDARRNGHRVLAVVRGSAVNQDGASNGLTAPNGPSQQRVIRQALALRGLSAADVDVVEAHGTGTRWATRSRRRRCSRRTARVARGSSAAAGFVKSNIGHTQAAAGVAGVIKMVQAMRHGVVPEDAACR
jgi:rifamycin polyketide synthase module 1/2/3